MSRVGKIPIALPLGVTVAVEKDQVTVNGPKGSLQQVLLPGISIETQDDSLSLSPTKDDPELSARYGLMRALVANMVTGVSQGFEKKLELHGVGYRVQLAGTDLKFNLGFSHEVVYKIPTGVQVSVEQNIITVSGTSKQQVGEAAAQIRSLRKPEPYKGKGIKYQDEQILRKSGKSGKEIAG